MSSSSSPIRRSTVIRPLRRESDRVIRSSVHPATFDNQLKNPLSPAESEAEPTWADGYEAGIEEGMSIGRALTTEEEAAHDRRVTSLCQAIEQAAERAIAEQQGIADRARESLIDTAFALSETLIERELRNNPRSGEEALRKALSLAPEHLSCVARLNPTDLEQIGSVEGRFTQRDLSLVADHSVEIGDCVIDLPAGQIELRLTDALAHAREVLSSSEATTLPDRTETDVIDALGVAHSELNGATGQVLALMPFEGAQQ